MSRKWFAVVAVVAVMQLLPFGKASALQILGHDYELLEGVDPVGAPSYTQGYDLGYFIWTDDVSRRDWHVRWSGDSKVAIGANYKFKGEVVLSANQFGDVTPFKFEVNDEVNDYFLPTGDMLDYVAFANVGHDGFDFSILGDVRPSYLGFNLNILPLTQACTDVTEIQNFIKIGAGMMNPESGDFAVAAPVPEPGTLLLLGGGLIGLFYLRKRKKA